MLDWLLDPGRKDRLARYAAEQQARDEARSMREEREKQAARRLIDRVGILDVAWDLAADGHDQQWRQKLIDDVRSAYHQWKAEVTR